MPVRHVDVTLVGLRVHRLDPPDLGPRQLDSELYCDYH